MKKFTWKFIVWLATAIFAAGLTPSIAFAVTWNGTPPTVADGYIVTLTDNSHGRLTVPANAEITIAGAANIGNHPFEIESGENSVINWQADLQSAFRFRAVQFIGDTTLVVVGDSTIISESSGIDVSGSLTVEGDGVLNIVAGFGGIFGGTGGISAEYDITVNGGEININSGLSGILAFVGDIVITGGTLNIETQVGLWASGEAFIDDEGGNVKITGGTVNILAGTGIWTWEGFGNVKITGGDVTITSTSEYGTGISADYGDIEIKTGTIIVFGDGTPLSSSRGTIAVGEDVTLLIDGEEHFAVIFDLAGGEQPRCGDCAGCDPHNYPSRCTRTQMLFQFVIAGGNAAPPPVVRRGYILDGWRDGTAVNSHRTAAAQWIPGIDVPQTGVGKIAPLMYAMFAFAALAIFLWASRASRKS